MNPKHSPIGIASFVMTLALLFSLVWMFLVVGLRQRWGSENLHTSNLLVGFAALGLTGMDVLALGLGVASIFQKDRNRLFGILGLVISSLILLGMLSLIIAGLLIQGRHPLHSK